MTGTWLEVVSGGALISPNATAVSALIVFAQGQLLWRFSVGLRLNISAVRCIAFRLHDFFTAQRVSTIFLAGFFLVSRFIY